jgi:hypothetical protein
MSWRYQKRIRVLPGVHLNLSKSGVGVDRRPWCACGLDGAGAEVCEPGRARDGAEVAGVRTAAARRQSEQGAADGAAGAVRVVPAGACACRAVGGSRGGRAGGIGAGFRSGEVTAMADEEQRAEFEQRIAEAIERLPSGIREGLARMEGDRGEAVERFRLRSGRRRSCRRTT